MSAKFGPAGNGELFLKSGFKSTAELPAWIASMGLSAYEYQCGRGINISDEKALEIGNAARQNGISISLHSPYFINLSSDDPERIQKNNAYILESCRVADIMGGRRVVVHCGGLSGRTREQAGKNTRVCLDSAISATEQAGFSHMILCLETMGKINVYGTLEEVCLICRDYERVIPCVDFGHINARTLGGLKSRDDFLKLFDTMENIIGIERARNFHVHFSKIQFSDGGEVHHLTLADTEYGPEFNYAAEIMAQRGYSPTVICESSGTQVEDAVSLMKMFEEANKN